MALCLSRFLSYPLPRPAPSQQLLSYSTNLPSSYCPNRFLKFTALPFPCHNKSSKASFSASSAASMENPPQGYRRNVGICLMNPSSKKVFFFDDGSFNIFFFWLWDKALIFVFGFCFRFLLHQDLIYQVLGKCLRYFLLSILDWFCSCGLNRVIFFGYFFFDFWKW